MNNGKRTFSAAALLLSLPGAALAALLCAALGARAGLPGSPRLRIIWSGAFFAAAFLGGFLGLQLALALPRKDRVIRRRRLWPLTALLCAALLFALGAGGQALYMYSRQEAVIVPSAVDLVLLLDASGSMDASGYDAPRTEAACQFIESLRDDARVQAVSFAGEVRDFSALETMDAAGKAALEVFIRGIVSGGTTDFDAPLRRALGTLTREGRGESQKAILLLTDGEGDISPSVETACIDSGAALFTVRITENQIMTQQAQALSRLAAATGGFDVELRPDADGRIDTADMLAAFEDAFRAASEMRSSLSESLLLTGTERDAFHLAVRAVTLLLAAPLFALGYCGALPGRKLFGNLLAGAAAAALLTLCAPWGFLPCAGVFCALLAAAFITLEPEPGLIFNI